MSSVVEDFFGIFLRYSVLPNLSLSIKPAGRVTFENAFSTFDGFTNVFFIEVKLVSLRIFSVLTS